MQDGNAIAKHTVLGVDAETAAHERLSPWHGVSGTGGPAHGETEEGVPGDFHGVGAAKSLRDPKQSQSTGDVINVIVRREV